MSKRKNPLHIRIRLLLILFCLTLLVNGCDNQTSTDRAKGLSEQTVIPYDSLAMDTVDDPMILRFAGWDMGKQIHEKYGYQSHQEAFIDYTKILGKRKESIERYLGKPSSHADEGYTYRSNWGSITINYYKGICHDLTVDYVYDFKSYVVVLRGIGITSLKRPFAMNDSSLIYNKKIGNNLIDDDAFKEEFVNTLIVLPNSSCPNWRISLIM